MHFLLAVFVVEVRKCGREVGRYLGLEKSDVAKLVVVALGIPLALAQLVIDLLGDLGARLEDIVDLFFFFLLESPTGRDKYM